MARLDLQRPPSRLHARKHFRTYKRGYDTNPHAVWGDFSSTVASVSPTSAAIGATPTLTVTGTGFTTASKVFFEGDERPTTFVSPTQLTATVAAIVGPARTVNIRVSTGGSKTFQVT